MSLFGEDGVGNATKSSKIDGVFTITEVAYGFELAGVLAGTMLGVLVNILLGKSKKNKVIHIYFKKAFTCKLDILISSVRRQQEALGFPHPLARLSGKIFFIIGIFF